MVLKMLYLYHCIDEVISCLTFQQICKTFQWRHLKIARKAVLLFYLNASGKERSPLLKFCYFWPTPIDIYYN